MLPAIQRFEAFLERIEGGLLAALVLVMLLLASYNVFYRNVLVPFQASSYGSEPASAVQEPVASQEVAKSPEAGKDDTSRDGDADGFGGGFGDESTNDDSEGFGGGFGDEAESGDGADPGDDTEGFGGGFGDNPEPVQAKHQADDDEGFGGGFDDDAKAKELDSEEAEGFGGGFGDEAAGADSAGFGGGFEGDDDESGFGGGFGDDNKSEVEEKQAAPVPPTIKTVPTQPTAISRAIDDIKLEWIDVLLRQLVLVVGFLGAMLAARRRKHITIDALSNVVPQSWLPAIEGVTGALAAVICGFLAVSGWGLVQISREFPKELMSWADESSFQMMFPIGFGLLAFHFSVRVLENGAQMLGYEVEILSVPGIGEEEE